MVDKSIDFVIPDHQSETGIHTLKTFESLILCPNLDGCPTSSKDRQTPPPAFHVHVEHSEVTVDLFLQSKTLWFLPPLGSSVCSPIKLPSQFILASDQTVLTPWRPGRGSGSLKSECGPVVISKSHILLEAFLLLYARDASKRIGGFAIQMIAYMEEYVDDDGFLDTNQLPKPLKTSYKELREGKKPVRQWTNESRKALGMSEMSDDDSDQKLGRQDDGRSRLLSDALDPRPLMGS